LLDVEKMRPRRIESLPHSFPLNDKEHALQESLEKIPMPVVLKKVYERRVMVSDLDVNNHVNNTEYARWITDCVEDGDEAAPPPRSLQVNYLEEARLGETLVFLIGREDGQRKGFFVEGVNRANQAKVVQARIEPRV
jgi:acyl-ACP thioesterase